MKNVTKESLTVFREHITVRSEPVKARFPGEVKNNMGSEERVGGEPRKASVTEARETARWPRRSDDVKRTRKVRTENFQ